MDTGLPISGNHLARCFDCWTILPDITSKLEGLSYQIESNTCLIHVRSQIKDNFFFHHTIFPYYRVLDGFHQCVRHTNYTKLLFSIGKSFYKTFCLTFAYEMIACSGFKWKFRRLRHVYRRFYLVCKIILRVNQIEHVIEVNHVSIPFGSYPCSIFI